MTESFNTWMTDMSDDKQPSILIVDDEMEVIAPLRLALKNLGVLATVAMDAREALLELAKSQPDLVFLDIALPDRTGLEIMDEIEGMRYLALQQDLAWKNIPIVTYSSYSIHEFGFPDERGFRLIEHWQKPMTFGELSKYAKELLSKLGFLRRRESDNQTEFGLPDQGPGFLGIRDLPENRK